MPRDTTPPDVSNEATLFDGETEKQSAAESPGGEPRNARSGQSQGVSQSLISVTNGEFAAAKMTPGDELEVRLARMHFWKGAYTRRGVNLQRHFHPEPLVVTDLDLLAIEITSQLSLMKTML